MQLTKKDKVMMGIAGGLLLIVIIVYAVILGGGEKGDPINPEEYKANPTRATHPGAKKTP